MIDTPSDPAARRVRRSLIVVPGNRPERIARAATLAIDAVVMDLEDGVAPGDKPAARGHIAAALRPVAAGGVDFGGGEVMVRVGKPGTADLAADIAGLPIVRSGGRIDALFVPKVESAADVGALERLLPVPLPLVLSIETPRGLFAALEIAEASPHAEALFFGSGDYTAVTGGRPTPEALQVPRALIAAAAGQAGLQAIDAAYFLDPKDAAATRADALAARDHGFCGKLLFHPNQVEPANAVFTPTAEEAARALRIIAGYEAAVARGEGTAIVEGMFVAVDLIPALRRIVAVARHAGLRF